MEYLKYRIYQNETDYDEVIYRNNDFTLEMGMLSNDHYDIKRYADILTISTSNLENKQAANKFISNIANKYAHENEIYKIEIDLDRNNGVNEHYVFNNGDFGELSFIYMNNEHEQVVRLIFRVLNLNYT